MFCVVQRVEYSSRELEQLKLLDAAIDDEEEDALNSDSLNFPENDNMELTDNEQLDDDYTAIDDATNILLQSDPHAFSAVEEMEMTKQSATKSIFENDTDNRPREQHSEQMVGDTKRTVVQTAASGTNAMGEHEKRNVDHAARTEMAIPIQEKAT